jgi:hypothetical protein
MSMESLHLALDFKQHTDVNVMIFQFIMLEKKLKCGYIKLKKNNLKGVMGISEQYLLKVY